MKFDLRRKPTLAGIGVALALAAPLVAVAGGPDAATQASVRASSTDDVSELIIKYRDSSATAAAVLSTDTMRSANLTAGRQALSLKHVRRTGLGSHVVRMDRKVSLNDAYELARRIQQDDANVEYAEPNRRMYPMFTPNDTRFGEQWHYFEATAGINAPAAWDKATGAGVVVGVIDTGYRPHADLAANIVPGFDFITSSADARDGNGRDDNALDEGDFCDGDPSSWHGTHVAGTIAAVTNNGSGVAGVAFGAKVQPLRVLGTCGGTVADIADAIIWGSGGTVSGLPANATPSRVLNLSLGGSGSCGSTFQNAINGARSRGTVVVVAAGNSNLNASGFSPANCTGVITVASVNRAGSKSNFSNFGTSVEIAAPGGSTAAGTPAGNTILSTLNAGTTNPGADSFAFYSGTSMATPHVAGVVALMLSVAQLTPDQVLSALQSSARAFPPGSSCTTTTCGSGILDANAAVDAALNIGNPPAPTPPVAAFTSSCTSLTCNFNASSSTGSPSSFSWNFGDGTTGTGVTTSHTYAAAGTFSVTLTASNANGSDTETASVTVTSTNVVAEVEPNNSRTAAQLISAPVVTVNGTIASSGDNDYYRVDLPAGATLTARLTPNATSDYDLYVYNSNGSLIGSSELGGSAVDTVTVTNTGTSTFARFVRVIRFSGGTGATNGRYTLELSR